MIFFNLYIRIKYEENMKKTKTKTAITIAISKDVNKYLSDNFENKSKYIEYLINKDLIENGIIIEKKYKLWEKN
jgi:hypothetical protein